jgi:hypothetical protein
MTSATLDNERSAQLQEITRNCICTDAVDAEVWTKADSAGRSTTLVQPYLPLNRWIEAVQDIPAFKFLTELPAPHVPQDQDRMIARLWQEAGCDLPPPAPA